MENLLWVIHAEIGGGDTDQLLRSLRRMGENNAHTLLLFCDLTAADTAQCSLDDAAIRALQSGIMSMERRAPGKYLLLVRRREWDDASRAYLGKSQRRDVRGIIGQLLQDGRTDIAFQAASFSPGALKGRYSLVLFMDADLACTPDTPQRMADALAVSGGDCITARVLPKRMPSETLLTRLTRLGFSLSPLDCAREALLARKGLSPARGALMMNAGALSEPLPNPDAPCPLAANCFFIRQSAPSLSEALSAFRLRCMRRADAASILPLVQAALLACCALFGAPWLSALAVLLPELAAFVHPRLLPGALVRTALLPLLFAAALDAHARRLLARSPRFRIELLGAAFHPSVCSFWGGALLLAAFISAHALVPLLAISLLWLAAPLIVRALHCPARERIPLTQWEQRELRTLAETAFLSLPPALLASASPPLAMLAACAGCMLSMLEPDETARQVQTQLERTANLRFSSAHEQGMLLACAQYLRERMGDCDAALRELPARLEAFALSQPLPDGGGLLAAFLCAARSRDSSVQALTALREAEGDELLDGLLLPLVRPDSIHPHEIMLPLTHPHGYLRAAGQTAATPSDPLGSFLFLSAAALAHPFFPLLMRSPVTGPYAPLFSML